MGIIIAVVGVIWVWSYSKFRRKYKIDKELLEYLTQQFNSDPTPETQLEYASGLLLCQQYSQAGSLFEDLRQRGFSKYYPFIETNIQFCKKPHPWSTTGKNFKGSWRHNFLLTRFGKPRQIYITEDTQLDFNRYIRQNLRNN